MIEVEHLVQAGPEAVWAVLADGWRYASWVVGAVRVRDVEPQWPQEGARLHHSVGVWPLTLDDHTSVIEATPGQRLVLQARGWPFGEATITLNLQPEDTPQGPGCRVRMAEDASNGPGRLVPLRQLGIVPRNRETLRRLAVLAEHL